MIKINLNILFDYAPLYRTFTCTFNKDNLIPNFWTLASDNFVNQKIIEVNTFAFSRMKLLQSG